MKSEHLTPLATMGGPFVSVYFDDAHDSAEAQTELDIRWRVMRRDLLDGGAAEVTVAAIERAVLHGTHPVGRRGRGVIAAGDRVLIDVQLASPPVHTVVRVSQYPYFLPLLDTWRPPYVFAAVDHLGADIAVHHGDTVHSETVDGGGYPVHKPQSAGWHGYGDVERSTAEAVRMNVRAVADRLTALMDQSAADVLFIAGEVRARSEMVAALPDRVAAHVTQLPAGAQGGRMDEVDADDAIVAELDRRRSVTVEQADVRFRAEMARASGLAAEGIPAVCAALRAGDVDTLIVGNPGESTVLRGSERTFVAPDPDTLSDLGEAPCEVVRADEALPFVALTVGGQVIRAADDIALVDGVAALLRYPMPTVAGTAAARQDHRR